MCVFSFIGWYTFPWRLQEPQENFISKSVFVTITGKSLANLPSWSWNATLLVVPASWTMRQSWMLSGNMLWNPWVQTTDISMFIFLYFYLLNVWFSVCKLLAVICFFGLTLTKENYSIYIKEGIPVKVLSLLWRKASLRSVVTWQTWRATNSFQSNTHLNSINWNGDEWKRHPEIQPNFAIQCNGFVTVLGLMWVNVLWKLKVDKNMKSITKYLVFCWQGREDPFYILDVGDLVQKIKIWKLKMPRIKPFYGELILIDKYAVWCHIVKWSVFIDKRKDLVVVGKIRNRGTESWYE